MGLNLPSGGHLTHGFYTKKKKISASSIFFESLGYHLGDDGYINYDELEKLATYFIPKLIICGYSAYPRDLDYKRFRKISDINNSILMCDMAHFSGLVATNLLKNPFEYCDIVTTTTHKTLRGPRAGMIFYKLEYKTKIDQAVFPALQGGPHNHQIAGIATQLKEVMTPEYKIYAEQIIINSKTLAQELINFGYTICTNGTDNHIVLINLRPLNITGSKVEKICEYCDISVNKNAIYGDKSALSPSGIRIGTPALTTRGFKEKDFKIVAKFFHICVLLALVIQKKSGKKLKNFVKELEINYLSKIEEIRKTVNKFANKFEFYN